MPYPVRYSTRSYEEYEEIFDYVFEKFGATVAVKVDMYFESIIDQIAINPKLYPYSDKKKKTSGVVSSVRKQHCIIVSTGKM